MFLHALVCCMCVSVSVGDFCEIYHLASGSINAECLRVCVYALRFVCVIWSCSFCFYSVNLCAISADCLCDSL